MPAHSLKPDARLKPDVIAVPIEYVVEHESIDDLVVYDPRLDETHILNGTAAIVWWLADGESTVAEIGTKLAALYQLNPDDLASDVSEVLHRFRRAGLVSW